MTQISARRACLALLLHVCLTDAAWAQTAPATPPAAPRPTGFWEQANLLPDPGGVRASLANAGISLGLQETSEVLGNATGGVHRGVAYDGVTLLSLGVDTAAAFGWQGGIFNVSAFQIHGRDLTSDNGETLQTISSLNASRSSRLWELWYQQAIGGGAIDIKIGQQSLDQEFIISQGSSLFINAAAGWPALPSADQYAGGAVYPLSALGVRLRWKPSNTVTLLSGAFDDNSPGGPFADDADVRGAEQSGTKFNLRTGALFIAEIQYAPAPPPSGLAGVFKLGGWYDTGPFPDQRIDGAGLSLADPAGSGLPRRRHGNFSIYAVADQAVWRPDPGGARTAGVFARVMGAPGDRNMIDFSANAGVTLKAPVDGRDNDIVGISIGYAHISAADAGLDRDSFLYSGVPTPVRSAETYLELTYQGQVTPWWVIQPDLQYVFLPSGGIANPAVPGKRIGNELVIGVRTNVTF